MKCDSRISISDYGYYECELEKNHEGEHCWFSKRENNINKKYPSYKVTWEKNEFNDVNVDFEWYKNKTNLLEVIEEAIVFFKNYYNGYFINENNEKEESCSDCFELCINLIPNEDYLKEYKDYYLNINKYEKEKSLLWIEDYFENYIENKLNVNISNYKTYIRSNVYFNE